ncbi:probable E3 ubiquitin-protein ligase sinah isoform X1 [Diorhabda sublineata]|uniref:probable E3 ubiquitin-protein ligase sinah isoform X1 n=1 Tax=Diorhabda sublineata TaxID=1163346 RepID=UPI0024E0D93F|nr:probable E3 ubiquitin-protein ligase sinah isoform X1 [Diorhabda sublineata]XP_056631306.1 probable E3 ubiquitin-protein ligase sinah isoform X1 [Diorhabda sublineata]XP_056631307.1 probable E3 ubiquitin-protein ligase sinah isoform X1 [Diorhabda sublineata]
MECTSENSLISKFECPVCFKYMIPPIRLCLSGHSYCSSCFDKLKNCALCRANKSPYRCIVLEQIHATLSFPCKYYDQGCVFRGKGDVMTDHQEYCDFSPALCPLRFNECEWRGSKSEILDHCRNLHPDNLFFENKQKLKVTNFYNIMNRNYFILFYIFDTVFRCTWDLIEDSGTVRFAVYVLNKPSKLRQYSFKITVFDTQTNMEVITLMGPCYYLKDDNLKFLGKKYLSSNHDYFKGFCDNNGDLNYAITIINNIRNERKEQEDFDDLFQ